MYTCNECILAMNVYLQWMYTSNECILAINV